jgi:tripartite-type tricarboxylate transporter receptor subunit TctC
MPAVMAPVLDKEAPEYSLEELVPLGSADTGSRVCVMTARSGITSMRVAQEREAMMGVDGAGSSRDMYTNMLRHLAGAKFKTVGGYRGSVDIMLAMERGEVDGICGIEWQSIVIQRPQWLHDGTVRVIVQVGRVENAPLVNFGHVPDMREFMSAEDREVAQYIVSEQAFARFFGISRGVPDEQTAILRKAFMDTLEDEALLQDARRMGITITPIPGEEVERLLRSILSASPEIAAKAKRAVNP